MTVGEEEHAAHAAGHRGSTSEMFRNYSFKSRLFAPSVEPNSLGVGQGLAGVFQLSYRFSGEVWWTH